jgi:hypothetical protein
MPIPRIANFHWVRIFVRDQNPQEIEWGSYKDMKCKVLDGGLSDHLRCIQQCQDSIVVCNLKITYKLETFYVNMGKPGREF